MYYFSPCTIVLRPRFWIVALGLCLSTLASATQSKLVCSPCSVAFGTVNVGSSKSMPITFTNSGTSAITISSKIKNAAWVSPSGLTLPYTLAAGKSVAFHLVYAPQDTRAVNGTLTYQSNASNANLVLNVTGTGNATGQLVANPAARSFGSVQVGQTSTLNQTLTNQSSSNVNITKVASTGSDFSVSSISTPLSLAPNHSVTFQARFSPHAVGASTGQITVSSNAVNSTLNIGEAGTGTSSGTVSVSPATLTFGSVAVGSKKTLSGTLAATGASVTVKSASFSSSEYSLSGLTLPVTLSAGKSVSFAVTFAPQSAGTANASVSFANSASNTVVKASLQGTGTGTSGHTVTLSWKASTSTVMGYNVYRGTKAGGPYSVITSSPVASTSYVDSAVQGSTTYYYVVTSVNNSGQESTDSNQVSAAVP